MFLIETINIGSESYRFMLTPRHRLARVCAFGITPLCSLHALWYVTQLAVRLINRYKGMQE